MPQGRIVRKRICQSRKLARLKTDGARLLYTWLLPNVDVEGRYEADVHVIKGTILTRLTKSTKEVESYLLDLAENSLIVLYNCNGDRYLGIADFHLHQPKLRKDREAVSEIPGPAPDQVPTNSGPSPAEDKSREDKSREEKSREEKLREGKGNKTLFGDFVYLTTEEHTKLVEKFGETDTKDRIERLDNYIGSTGKKYKSHYHTILNWAGRDEKEGSPRKRSVAERLAEVPEDAI